jgi:hypothetical protein
MKDRGQHVSRSSQIWKRVVLERLLTPGD